MAAECGVSPQVLTALPPASIDVGRRVLAIGIGVGRIAFEGSRTTSGIAVYWVRFGGAERLCAAAGVFDVEDLLAVAPLCAFSPLGSRA